LTENKICVAIVQLVLCLFYCCGFKLSCFSVVVMQKVWSWSWFCSTGPGFGLTYLVLFMSLTFAVDQFDIHVWLTGCNGRWKLRVLEQGSVQRLPLTFCLVINHTCTKFNLKIRSN